jgi:hypothetical protein
MRRDRPMKKLVLNKSTLRELTDNELKGVVGAGTGSCGGGVHSCCQTGAGQASCDIDNRDV